FSRDWSSDVCSSDLVDVAADIARKSGAQLTLLHVIEEVSGDSINVDGEVAAGSNWEDRLFTLKLIERAKKQMAKLVDDPKLADVKVKTALRVGTPYHGMNEIGRA